MSLEKLSTMQQLDELLGQNKTLIFLKNSTTCPVSHEAFREFEKLSKEMETETFYYLNVQEARPFSNEIAEKFAVKHESPQALLFNDGEVAWHTSHWNITYKVLKELFK